MIGHGVSYGALSVINAISTGKGAAFGISLKTEAAVQLIEENEFTVKIDGHPAENTALARFAVEELLRLFPDSGMSGAVIKTTSNIPISRGLKSSSSAANAIISAAAGALGVHLDPLEIGRIGAACSVKAGVSITGAFDDACACQLGGLVFTDNLKRELLLRRPMPEGLTAVIHIPQFQIRKSAFPKEKVQGMRDMISAAYDLAVEGDIFSAMYVNGRCTSEAIGITQKIADKALSCGAVAAGLSGTGPATGILVPEDRLDEFLDRLGREDILLAGIRNGE